MSLLARRGFTLIELMIALVLLGMVSAAVYKVLVNNQRVYLAQTQTIDLQQNTRADDIWLPAQIQSINGTGLLCNDSGPAGPLTVPHAGISLRMQPQWLANPGLNVATAITRGAPVRGFDRVSYELYQAPDGNWYLGQRNPAVGGTIQPVVGPLIGANGLTFSYYDRVGTVTADSSKVAQIQFVLRARTASPIRSSPAGAMAYKVDSILTRVALRNNPRCGTGSMPPVAC